MDNTRVIASSLTDNELAQAFSELVADRWGNWDLSPFMALLVDTCAPSVLPYLAEQFDVEGLRGFEIAANEDQQRELIKRSIALHKYMGTPWALREACRTVGFPVIVLEEGVTAIPGGPTSPDDWARFRVLVEADESRHITEEEARKLRLFVEYYKNARSQLVELGFYHKFVDEYLFTNYVSDRDDLEIITLEVEPNPLIVPPDGASQTAVLKVSAPYVIEPDIIEWPDGTGEKLYLSYSGTPGEGYITATSDPNTKATRFVDVPIKSLDGRTLGTLLIRQPLLFGNAYSRAYSNAYNPYLPVRNAYGRDYCKAYNSGEYAKFVGADPDKLSLSQEAENDVQMKVNSNTDWNIQ